MKTIDDVVAEFLRQLKKKCQSDDFGELSLTVKYQAGTFSVANIVDNKSMKLLKNHESS